MPQKQPRSRTKVVPPKLILHANSPQRLLNPEVWLKNSVPWGTEARSVSSREEQKGLAPEPESQQSDKINSGIAQPAHKRQLWSPSATESPQEPLASALPHKLVLPYGKQYSFFKTLKIKLPYDLAIPLLGIYPKRMKTLIWIYTCTPMFTTTLFTVQFGRSVMSDSATPWITAHQASLSTTNSQSLPKLMSIESVMPSNHLILCRPLLLLPSIFSNIRVFSNESRHEINPSNIVCVYTHIVCVYTYSVCVYTYAIEYYSDTKKNETLQFAAM